jgi:hypothetical protein
MTFEELAPGRVCGTLQTRYTRPQSIREVELCPVICGPSTRILLMADIVQSEFK